MLPNPDIIGTSALLTTTTPQQKKLEQELKKKGLKGKYKTIVGGGTGDTAVGRQNWSGRLRTGPIRRR